MIIFDIITMRYLYIFIVIISFYKLQSQCSVSFTMNVTPPSCSVCCDGSIQIVGASGCAPFTATLAPCCNPFGPFLTASNLCPGTYSVTVMDAGCCSSTTQTCIVDPNSTNIIENGKFLNITISPNPSDGKISFSSEYYSSDIEMKIYDVMGKFVSHYDLKDTKQEKELDLNSGVYFIKLIDKKTDQQSTRKIIIQK